MQRTICTVPRFSRNSTKDPGIIYTWKSWRTKGLAFNLFARNEVTRLALRHLGLQTKRQWMIVFWHRCWHGRVEVAVPLDLSWVFFMDKLFFTSRRKVSFYMHNEKGVWISTFSVKWDFSKELHLNKKRDFIFQLVEVWTSIK